MTEEQSILLDILKIVPDNSVCYINAPSIDVNSAVLKILQTSDNHHWCVVLTEDSKRLLSEVIKSESIQDHFHQLNIKYADSPLCESYDGMCTVILQGNLDIPVWFKDKYVNDEGCWSMR